MAHTMEQALGAIEACLKLAEETADAALAQHVDLAGLGAMFVARASQALYSVGLLSQNGLVGDAMSVGRTVVEMSIDYAYIAKDPTVRVPKFEAYDHVAKFKHAKAIAKLHGGAVPSDAMRILEERHDTARLNNPESKSNWAGVTIRERAVEAGRLQLYELPYADMCNASHSCYGTLEYALVGLDSSPSIRFGLMPPNVKPIDLTFSAMALLMAEVIDACGLDKNLGERVSALFDKQRQEA